MRESPQLLYAAVGGLLGGSLFLILFGWPLGKLLLKLVLLDRRVVLPLALGVTMVGVFALRRSVFDVYVLLMFGLIGYFMLRYGYSTAAAAVGMILGPGLELNLRQGLLLMDSSVVRFVSRPWTASILLVAVGLLIYGAVGNVRLRHRRQQEQERVAEQEQ